MTLCPEPFLDQAQDPRIRDPVLNKPLKPLMVKTREVVAEVRVEHPVHTLPQDPGRERIQRVMRTAPRPKSVRETEEVLLVDGVQHLDHRPLQDLVLQRGCDARSHADERTRR